MEVPAAISDAGDQRSRPVLLESHAFEEPHCPGVLDQRLQVAPPGAGFPEPIEPPVHQSSTDTGPTHLRYQVDMQVSRPSKVVELPAVGFPRIADLAMSSVARAKNAAGLGRKTSRYFLMA